MARRGFFSEAELLEVRKPISLSMLPKCDACGLDKGCQSPKMKPTGAGGRRILVVGEAPGGDEDLQGRQFVGKAGKRLRTSLYHSGIDPDTDVWWTNALICRPPGNVIKDLKAVEYCRPNLLQTLEDLKPEIVLLLGGSAVRSLIPYLWREGAGDTSAIGKWAGWRIPSQKINAWVCPTWHPSYLEREENPVLDLWFQRHIDAVAELSGRPWPDGPPDYRSQVRSIFTEDESEAAIAEFIDRGLPTSFDFETNMLKPDNSDARIVCVSLSDGTNTVAFPWTTRVMGAFREFAISDVPKYGWNLKFEHKWTKAFCGVRVRNWKLCGMTGSHVLDNRPDINSLKFQAFVRLGQDGYDHHIKQFLKSKDAGGNAPNRIGEIDLGSLLLYCGMDSLLEHILAEMMEATGVLIPTAH